MQLSDVIGPYGRHIRQMFYLVTPWESTYTSLDTVPPVIDEVIPWFILLIGLEIAYCWKKGLEGIYQFEDSIVSLGAGFFQTIVDKVALRTLEMSMYVWIFENWTVYKLSADSVWTWLITFVVVDFFYYWFHRAAHEINVLWALHSTHHSSEYYNFSTALRQSAIQQYTSMFFYLPQALLIPPPMHVAHEVLNRLFQVWLHTVHMGRLGPVEWILNTPSHHRVHHGRNPYCIDKNYGGTLIIWDRMFGTFQEELDSEPVLYGLTHNVNSFDAMDVQLHHIKHIFLEKLPNMHGFGDKARALFYGPGWSPNKPRLGNLDEIPEAVPIERYHSGVAPWVSVYVLIQGFLTLSAYQAFAKQLKDLPWLVSLQFAAAMIYTIWVTTAMLDKRRWTPYGEIIRCLLNYVWLYPMIWPRGETLGTFERICALISASIWILLVLALKRKPILFNLCQKFSKDS